MDIKQQTQNVANQGRYGDSMLLHVNPAEVKGLAQAMPITVNPQTGQPEAFLPFLAPMLGSWLGTTFLTSLSPALAAGIGAGAATYAQSGGSGSKALLSGLTAGFGTSAANTAAQAAATDTATQAAVASGTAPAQAATDAAIQAAANPRVATGPLTALKDTFAGGFDQGAKSLATGLMSPSGMVAGASLGGRGVIHSQELFEQEMRKLDMEEEERRRRMYANHPEVMLYSASGGMTQFQGGGDTDYGYESKKQVYAPAKTQYAVNPNFMAGFAPETMYFRPDTINAPTTSLRGGVSPILGPDTYTGTKGGYDYEGSFDADGNYIPGTAQGVEFAPHTTIDPYAAFTGSAPLGLIESAYDPYPVPPIKTLPIDDSDYTGIGIGDGGENGSFYEEADNSDQGYFSDMDLNLAGAMGRFNPADYMGASGITNQFFLNKEIQDYLDSLNTTTDIGDYFTADGPMGKAKGGITKYANQGQTEMDSQIKQLKEAQISGAKIGQQEIMDSMTQETDEKTMKFLRKYAITPHLMDVGFFKDPSFDKWVQATRTANQEGLPIWSAPSFSDSIDALKTGYAAFIKDFRENFTPKDFENQKYPSLIESSDLIDEQLKNYATTGDWSIMNEGLSAIKDYINYHSLEEFKKRREERFKTMDMVRNRNKPTDPTEQLSFTVPSALGIDKDIPIPFEVGRLKNGYANQGQTEIMSPPVDDFMQDPMTQEVIAFLMGDSDNTNVVDMFVEKYGSEAFMTLREMVLNPDGTKQTEGLIEGVGNGGMDDDLLGSIGNKEKIAVSQDEFIVPADVVSGIGDGSSQAGSEELYAMMDRVRQKRTGTTKQPAMLANAGGLLPA